MCIAVPAEVIEVYENEALVSFGGVETKADISLVDSVAVGDYILLHAGCAIQNIDKNEAELTLELFENMLKDNVLRSFK